MKISFRLLLITAFYSLIGANFLFGQTSNWVDFVDEPGRIDQSIYIDNQEKDIAVGDIDNDGDDDLIIVRKLAFSVDGPRYNLLLMNENGNLVDRTEQYIPSFKDPDLLDNARDVQLFDSDNNGWLDIIVANTFGSYHRLYINQGEQHGAWQGYEDQGANNGDWYSPPLPMFPQCCGIAIGDVNGDDFPDFFTVDYLNDLEARLFINNQDNTYTDESDRLTASFRSQNFGTTAFIADMNGDNHNDIVSNDALGGPGVEIAFNDGTGNFNQVQLMPTVASYMVERADFNNDDRLDMYVVDDLQDYIILNNSTNGNGTINVTTVPVTNSQFTTGFNGNIRPADVDQDGWMDMAVCDVDVDIPGCSRTFCLLQNNQQGALSDPNNSNPQSWNVDGSHDMAWIDINCDGQLDMFIAVCGGDWTIPENKATEPGYHMFVNTAPILLGDVNRDGVVDFLDIQPFVDLLNNGGCNAQADVNEDGVVDFLDINGFVDLLG